MGSIHLPPWEESLKPYSSQSCSHMRAVGARVALHGLTEYVDTLRHQPAVAAKQAATTPAPSPNGRPPWARPPPGSSCSRRSPPPPTRSPASSLRAPSSSASVAASPSSSSPRPRRGRLQRPRDGPGHHRGAARRPRRLQQGTSRLNLRLPDALKVRVEQAARTEGLSLNAWLLRAAAAALGPAPHHTSRAPAASGSPDGSATMSPAQPSGDIVPSFDTPHPTSVTIELAQGDVHLIATDRDNTVVVVNPVDPSRPADVEAAEQTEVEQSGGGIVVRAPRRRSLGDHWGSAREARWRSPSSCPPDPGCAPRRGTPTTGLTAASGTPSSRASR